ncbi:MAG: hypothetical protein ACK5MU_01685 [Candidatus Saccharimonadales bacterium]
MSATAGTEKSIELRIDIIREKIAEQSGTFDRMHDKCFAIISLILAIGGLFAYDVFKINDPDTLLEWIILIAALVSFGVAAGFICVNYRSTKTWPVPIGDKEISELNHAKDHKDVLVIIHDDYLLTQNDRETLLAKKAKFLNSALYLFFAGVILIILLKLGG